MASIWLLVDIGEPSVILPITSFVSRLYLLLQFGFFLSLQNEIVKQASTVATPARNVAIRWSQSAITLWFMVSSWQWNVYHNTAVTSPCHQKQHLQTAANHLIATSCSRLQSVRKWTDSERQSSESAGSFVVFRARLTLCQHGGVLRSIDIYLIRYLYLVLLYQYYTRAKYRSTTQW